MKLRFLYGRVEMEDLKANNNKHRNVSDNKNKQRMVLNINTNTHHCQASDAQQHKLEVKREDHRCHLSPLKQVWQEAASVSSRVEAILGSIAGLYVQSKGQQDTQRQEGGHEVTVLGIQHQDVVVHVQAERHHCKSYQDCHDPCGQHRNIG